MKFCQFGNILQVIGQFLKVQISIWQTLILSLGQLLWRQQQHQRKYFLAISVTRFGEILPIWQYSASLWAISKSLN